MTIARSAMLGAMLALVGCSTGIQLTGDGERVRHVSRADMPTGCNLLGDVAIGIPPDAARPRTEEELVILMRNKAGDMGGNHVVMDSSEERRDAADRPYFRGRGVGYACQTAEAPSEGDTGGGEVTEEGGAEATAEAEPEPEEDPAVSAEEDAMLEELLAD